MDNYESSPTIKFEGSGEGTVDDNHSEKTGSEGSEGFIKVDQVIEEHEAEKPPVSKQSEPETIPTPDASLEKKNHLESYLGEHLDPKAPFSVTGDDVVEAHDESDAFDQPDEVTVLQERTPSPEVTSTLLVDLCESPVDDVASKNVTEETPPTHHHVTKSEGCGDHEDISDIESIPRDDPTLEEPCLHSQGSVELISEYKDEDPVVDLLFWRDARLSAVTFTLSLLILLSLQFFSVVSVVAYLGLSLLTVTITFRLYKFILQTLNGTQQPNPFQQMLDADITISSQQAARYTDAILVHVNNVTTSTRDLVLVKNTLSSLKFGLLMWLLTYVGCCFNGLTLLTVDVLLMFILPPIYEKYQQPIDAFYGKARSKADDITSLVKSKLPGSKPKTQ